jgi:hypothetical protein
MNRALPACAEIKEHLRGANEIQEMPGFKGFLARMHSAVTMRLSSSQPAAAAPQLWRGTRFSSASSRLAAPNVPTFGTTSKWTTQISTIF